VKDLPDFRTPEFLREHVLQTMAFYNGRCIDPAGGFFHFYKDDGTVHDRHTRHLVSSARFVVTHAWAAQRFPTHEHAPAWRTAVGHGVRFLRDMHRDPRSGGYSWLLHFDGGRKTVLDDTQCTYGLACVLLAHTQALALGLDSANDMAQTFTLLERHFWEPEHGLYADGATPDWRLSSYRGQAANMHACEALLAAYEQTGETPYLQRASSIAQAFVQRLAQAGSGLMWEHYHSDWTPDWEDHRDASNAPLRPWGYQVGHLAEWARLLLKLERMTVGLDDDNWMQHRARQLFAAAVEHGWDRAHGGLARSLSRQGTVCDGDKLWWVQAEAIGAAAALAERTGEGGYWDWYDRLWACCWEHFVDHRHGAWYRQLGADNTKADDDKSPGGKTDYHAMGACYEALDALERIPELP
jgi:mannose/cellobiose epimerase-like protein (N-acyl-D-glucosamine 2-epimerase family)